MSFTDQFPKFHTEDIPGLATGSAEMTASPKNALVAAARVLHHPIANILPMLDEAQLEELTASVNDLKFAYHFTDTVRLPWIIEAGELRPGQNTIGGFPRDLLWATRNDCGDRTSSAMSPAGLKLWRSGASQLVRLTLHESDFVSFPEIAERDPDWTDVHIRRLYSAAAAMGENDTDRWLCRSEPLRLTQVVRAEAKSYTLGRWTEIDLSLGRCIKSSKYPYIRGVVVGKNVYMSRRVMTATGAVAYDDVARLPLETAA